VGVWGWAPSGGAETEPPLGSLGARPPEAEAEDLMQSVLVKAFT